jgi:hypothetical protein
MRITEPPNDPAFSPNAKLNQILEKQGESRNPAARPGNCLALENRDLKAADNE